MFRKTCVFVIVKPQIVRQSLYKRASEKSGDVDCILGNAFRKGIGFPKNISYAIKHYKRGSIKGSRRATWFDCILRKHYDVLLNDFDYEKMFKSIDKLFFVNKNSFGYDDFMLIPRIAFYKDFRAMNCFPSVNYKVIRNYKENEVEINKNGITEKEHKRNLNAKCFNPTYIYDTIDESEVARKMGIDNSPIADQFHIFSTFFTLSKMKEYGISIDNLKRLPMEFDSNKSYLYNLIISHFELDLAKDEVKDGKELYLKLRIITIFQKVFKSIESKAYSIEMKDQIFLQYFTKFMNREADLDELFKEGAKIFENNMLDGVEKEKFENDVSKFKNYQPWHAEEIAFSRNIDSAINGNIDDQLLVAKSYFHGINGYPVNYREAARFFKMAADQKNVDGLYWFTFMQINGLGVPLNIQKAVEDLEQAAFSTKDPRIMFQYAVTLDRLNSEQIDYHIETDIKVIDILKTLCKQNYKDAKYLMGLYEEGFYNREVGRENALKNYLEAAKEGNMEAFRRFAFVLIKNNEDETLSNQSYYLGGLLDTKYLLILAKQLDKEGKHEDALSIIESLVNLENGDAIEMLADFKRDGKFNGEPQLAEAETLYAKVAKKRPTAALKQCMLIAEGLNQREDIYEAKKTFQKYINDISIPHKRILFMQYYAKFIELLYEKNRFTLFESFYNICYSLANETKKAEYQYKLGKLCINSYRVNNKQGWKYLLLEAEQKYPDACYLCGKYLVIGKNTSLFGVKQNAEEGLNHLMIASRENHVKAHFFLAKMHLKGLGVQKDRGMVEKYLELPLREKYTKAMYFAYKHHLGNKNRHFDYLILSSRNGHGKAQIQLALLMFKHPKYDYEYDVDEKWRHDQIIEKQQEKIEASQKIIMQIAESIDKNQMAVDPNLAIFTESSKKTILVNIKRKMNKKEAWHIFFHMKEYRPKINKKEYYYYLKKKLQDENLFGPDLKQRIERNRKAALDLLQELGKKWKFENKANKAIKMINKKYKQNNRKLSEQESSDEFELSD